MWSHSAADPGTHAQLLARIRLQPMYSQSNMNVHPFKLGCLKAVPSQEAGDNENTGIHVKLHQACFI